MREHYKTIYEGGEGEIIEKKSRFIATVRHVEAEEEALAFIEAMRKKYWDATHNCFAYVIGIQRELMRCSDDGEPQGTAGRPMLDVLLGEGLNNTVVVVTRYFGGALLGTGGLVRAYSKAVREGLTQSRVVDRKLGVLLEVLTDYNGIGKLQYLMGQRGLYAVDTEYTDHVRVTVLVSVNEIASFEAEVTEGTNGKARMQRLKQLYFAKVDKEILTWEN